MVARNAPAIPPAKARAADGKLAAKIDVAFRGVVERRRTGAEQPLKLVGAERFGRRKAGEKQGGQGYQPAAAGDRIDEARAEGSQAEQEDSMRGEVGHGARAGDRDRPGKN